MPITTTVTFQDLIDAQADELTDLKGAYDDVAELAREEYGDDALQRPADDEEHQTLQQQAAMYDRAAQQYQQRIHLLQRLAEEYGGGVFTIKMLSAEEVLDTEVQLRADTDGADEGRIQSLRNQRTVNAATVEAPEGIPTDDSGDPKPSDAPNALVDSLFDAVQRFNTAGATDFRAEGFGGVGPASGQSGPSAAPSTSSEPSESSAPTDASTPDSGDDS